MPKPVTGIEIKIDPLAITKRPTIASHIGVITSAWTEIEDELALLYALALRTEPAWAALTLGCVSSMYTRITMIKTALDLAYPADVRKTFDEKFGKTVLQRARERNNLVHCIWAIHEKYPEGLIRFAGLTSKKMRFDLYETKDFRQIELRLLELLMDLKEFAKKVALGDFPKGPTAATWKIVSSES